MLPLVIPLVMYHGLEGAWTVPRRVEELFPLPGDGPQVERWRALVPRFEYLLDDLTSEREEALRARSGSAMARLTLLMLRFGRTGELSLRLESWRALFADVYLTEEGPEDLRAVVRYLAEVGDEATHEAVRRVLDSVAGEQRTEELMMTVGEKLIEKGRQQGLALGRAEGVLKILAVRGIPVDEGARQLVLSCTDLATLDQWLERAVTATRFSDLMENH